MPASSTPSFLTTLWDDAKAFVADVKAGLKWLGAEAQVAIAWVDKTVPGAQAALAALFQEADSAASTLANYAETGLQDAINTGLPDAETFVANLINATGANPALKALLDAGDVAAFTAAKEIAVGLVTVAHARVVSSLASAAANPPAGLSASPPPPPVAPAGTQTAPQSPPPVSGGGG